MTRSAHGGSAWKRLTLVVSLVTMPLVAECVGADEDPAGDAATPAPADSSGVPQRDITDVLKKLIHRNVSTEVTTEARRGISLTVLPSLGYNPSYGAFAGASIALGGSFGDPATTSISSANLGASYSTTQQISVQFRSDLFLPDNRWALKGDWRYLDTSQETFGLGNANPDRTAYPMDFVLYRLYQTVYHRVKQSPIYFGLGYHFDRYDNIHDQRAEQGESTPFSEYSGGTPSRTQSSGISANVFIDSRDNQINAARGLFWNASMRSYLRALGSDADRQTLWSDFRAYPTIPRGGRNVLAIWSFMWFTFGKAPYLDLPAVGWDTYGRSARGYLQGHLRGPDMVYTEFEYRMRFSRDDLWGGVVFLNFTAVTEESGGTFQRFDSGGGVGLRLKFNKKTNTNLSVDAALGQDDQVRFFFGLQEVF